MAKDCVLFIVWLFGWGFVTAAATGVMNAYGVEWATTEGRFWFGVGAGVLIARFMIWPDKWR